MHEVIEDFRIQKIEQSQSSALMLVVDFFCAPYGGMVVAYSVRGASNFGSPNVAINVVMDAANRPADSHLSGIKNRNHSAGL